MNKLKLNVLRVKVGFYPTFIFFPLKMCLKTHIKGGIISKYKAVCNCIYYSYFINGLFVRF